MSIGHMSFGLKRFCLSCMGHVNKHVLICMCGAGVTSENVAAKYGIARDTQDKMAVSSHQRAAKARDTGRFKDEIVPVKTMWKDPKSGVARHAVSSIHVTHVHNRSASVCCLMPIKCVQKVLPAFHVALAATCICSYNVHERCLES